MSEFPQYFFECLTCDATDHGEALYDYQVVDCPSCGSPNVHKWLASANLSREWSRCIAEGHQWASLPNQPTNESCARCKATRTLERGIQTNTR